VSVALTAAGLAVAAGDLSLIVACWKRRSVLGGVLGACGIPPVALSIAAGPSHGAGVQALLIAAIALVIGTALYVLGQALERLLDEEPKDAGRDGPARARLEDAARDNE
jgi:hypothetical protein